VFTLPQELAHLALHNPKQIYNILFRSASENLLTIAADPQHLGASIGFLAVLHTWGQNLHLHPHLHCVVPGGGISPDGSRWIACRKNFFLPVRVLSRLFRNKFLKALRAAFRHGDLRYLAAPSAFQSLWPKLAHREWVVYAHPLAVPSACSSIWLATHIGLPSPITGFDRLKTATSVLNGRTTLTATRRKI
jgi:hypothetical protein